MSSNDLGVLVVGHGTRDPIGQMQMRNLACQTAGRMAPLLTDLGFLELAQPTIAEGIERLAQAGIRRLITVPVLLFRAGHADHDIPDAVQAAADLHGIEVLCQTPPLEHQPTVIELSAQRFEEALNDLQEGYSTTDVSLALIARGSRSDTAAAAMERLAELRCQRTPVAQHRVGYVAVREPNLEQTLDWLASTASRILVVQPHLLFEGEVYHSICEAVEKRRSLDNRQWIVCQPLGAAVENFEDDRLAEVLAGLVRAHVERPVG